MTKTTTATVPTAELREGLKFTRKSDKSKLPIKLAELTASVEALSAVINDDDMTAIRKAQEDVNTALETYNKLKTLADYEDFLETEDPMKAALITGYITLKKVSTVKVLGVSECILEDVDVQVDFIALNAIGGRLMGAKTQLLASQVGYMVLLAKAEKDGNSVAEVTKAYQKAKNRPITKVFSKAPSKNELKEALQELIDAIYFEDNGSGKNKFMVTSGWLHWFCDSVNRTSYGKGNLSRSAKSVKAIVQTAAGLYHAFYHHYGITEVIDRENVVVPREEAPKTGAAKAVKKAATA